MKITHIAKVMRKYNIKILLWEEQYAKCMVKERVILMPLDYLDNSKLPEIVLALLHEVEHINRTTFDAKKLTDTKDQFFILNCMEDIRLDQSLMERYKLESLYRKVYSKLFGGKPFKRNWCRLQKIAWTTMLNMLGLIDTITVQPSIGKFIHKHNIKAKFLRGVGLLDELEADPTPRRYSITRKHIQSVTNLLGGK